MLTINFYWFARSSEQTLRLNERDVKIDMTKLSDKQLSSLKESFEYLTKIYNVAIDVLLDNNKRLAEIYEKDEYPIGLRQVRVNLELNNIHLQLIKLFKMKNLLTIFPNQHIPELLEYDSIRCVIDDCVNAYKTYIRYTYRIEDNTWRDMYITNKYTSRDKKLTALVSHYEDGVLYPRIRISNEGKHPKLRQINADKVYLKGMDESIPVDNANALFIDEDTHEIKRIGIEFRLNKYTLSGGLRLVMITRHKKADKPGAVIPAHSEPLIMCIDSTELIRVVDPIPVVNPHGGNPNYKVSKLCMYDNIVDYIAKHFPEDDFPRLLDLVFGKDNDTLDALTSNRLHPLKEVKTDEVLAMLYDDTMKVFRKYPVNKVIACLPNLDILDKYYPIIHSIAYKLIVDFLTVHCDIVGITYYLEKHIKKDDFFVCCRCVDNGVVTVREETTNGVTKGMLLCSECHNETTITRNFIIHMRQMYDRYNHPNNIPGYSTRRDFTSYTKEYNYIVKHK